MNVKCTYGNKQRPHLVQRRFHCKECATVYPSPPRSPWWHAMIYRHHTSLVAPAPNVLRLGRACAKWRNGMLLVATLTGSTL